MNSGRSNGRSNKRELLDEAPAHDLEAEKAVLGSVLMDSGRLKEVQGIVEPSDFWGTANQLVADAIWAMDRAGVPIDQLTLWSDLKGTAAADKIGGIGYIKELVDAVPVASHAAYYAQIVAQRARQRNVRLAGESLIQLAADEHLATTDPAAFDSRVAGTMEVMSRRRANDERFKTSTIRELFVKELVEQRQVVQGLVTEGLTILASRPKLGKTWMVNQFALAVASGGFALGKIEVESGGVLALFLEDTEPRLRSRLEMMLGPDPHLPELYSYATEWPRMHDGGLHGVEQWLDQHPETRLLVIDTLGRFRSPRQKGADPYQDDYSVSSEIKRVADQRSIAILAVAHTRKQDASDMIDKVSGTSGLTAGADNILVLTRERGKHDAALSIVGRDIEEQSLALSFDPRLGLWSIIGEAATFRLSDQRRAIIDTMARAGKPMGPSSVAAKIGKEPNAVKALMRKMGLDGELKAQGNGTYVLPGTFGTRIPAEGIKGTEGNRVNEGSSGIGIETRPLRGGKGEEWITS